MAMNLDAVLKISAQVIGQDGVDRLRSSIGGLSGVAESAKKGFGDMVKSASFQALAAGAAGVGVALGTSVREAMKFESAMADVRKVVPGLESADGLREMKGAIIDLSRELPISAQGLAEIVAAAGQAGIEKDQLVEFARAAAQMAVAFDMTAGEAGDAMAKLRTSMGLNQEEVVNLADAMNYLSNVQASSASQITDFMLRVGAFGQQVAMTKEQTAALGSAMIAAGAAPDVAATSFRNLIKEMAAGQNATKSQESAWVQLGLSADEVAKRMQQDAVPTIRDVFHRIAALPKEMQIPIAEALFGNEARAITPLLKNMKLFDESMAAVGNKTNYAGSMLKEFETRMDTSANKWQMLQNSVKAFQISIGESLKPVLDIVAIGLTKILDTLGGLARQFPGITAAVVIFAGAFVGLVAIMPFVAAFLYTLAQLSAIGVTFGAIAGIIGGLGATIAGYLGAVGPLMTGFIALVTGAFGAIGGVLTSLGTILVGVFSGPVGWIALLVAAAAALFVFREPIMAFFAWVGEAFTAWIASLALWAEPFTAWWMNLWAQVQLLTGTFFTWLGQQLYLWFVQPWVSLGQALLAATTAIWESVKVPITGFFQWWRTFLYQWFVEPWVVAGATINRLAGQTWENVKTTITGFFQWWGTFLYQWFVEPWMVLGATINRLAGQTWENVKTTITGFFQWWGTFLYQWFVEPWVVLGAKLGALMSPVWDGIRAGAAAVGQWIVTQAQTYFVKPFIVARDIVVTAWGQLSEMITTIWGAIVASVSNLAANVWAIWTGAYTYVVGTFQSVSNSFRTYMVEPVRAAWQGLTDWIISAWTKVATTVTGIYSKIAEGVRSAFAGVMSGVIGIINSAIRALNYIISGINRVRSAVGLSALATLPEMNMPSFAQGGVVNRPTVALVGEGGEPEYIIPESKMASAAANYLDGARNQAVLMARRPQSLTPAGGGATQSGGAGPVMVNITTGPVLDQGGQKYVTLQDLEAAVRQTSTQIYATLRTPSGRRSMGLA